MLSAFRVPSLPALSSTAWARDVAVSMPRRVAAYRKQRGGRLICDTSLLPPAYVPVAGGADLSAGVEAYAGRPDGYVPDRTDVLLDAVRRCCASGGKGLTAEEAVAGVRLVTFRNSLNYILGCPYSKDPWQIGVRCTPDGLVRLEMEEYDGPEAGGRRSPLPREQQLKFEYWGRRFEALCTGAAAVDLEEETCVVQTMRLGRHRLLVGAEIDCWTEAGAEAGGGAPVLVELKTTRAMETPRQHASFQRHKLLKWWIQSFVAGVPRILAGVRDDAGVLLGVHRIDTLRIPRMVREGRSGVSDAPPLPARMRAQWSANACLSFADRLLDWLLREVSARRAAGDRGPFALRFEPPFREVSLVRA